MTEQTQTCCTTIDMRVENGWLAEIHNHCTCGGSGILSPAHPPGCGLVGIVPLADIDGMAAHDRQVAERAWDEGATAGRNRWMRDDDNEEYPPVNPHRADSPAPRPATPGVPVTGVSAEQVRTDDGPCNMLNAHGPHRWDNRDTVNLRWKCPGVTVTDGGAL